MRLEEESWDLLITDVMMPGMSGYELTRRVRERYPVSELPVLLLTARAMREEIYYGFQQGANDYVTKPVDSLELKYRVTGLARLKQTIDHSLRLEGGLPSGADPPTLPVQRPEFHRHAQYHRYLPDAAAH